MPYEPQERQQFGARLRRTLQTSLTAHWALASLFLLSLIPIVGFDDVWSADVGAQLAQSQQLADGGGWRFSHPFAEVDPTGDWFTFHLAGRVDPDYVVLAKHPAFSLLVAGLLKIGGLGLVMAFSTLSTSTAALGVGTLVRLSSNTNAAILSVWIVAATSPLAFNAYLGYGHSFAAALAIWSMVAIVAHIRSGQFVHYGIPVSVLLAFAGPFVRSESLLVGVALGLATGLTSRQWWTVAQRRIALTGGALLTGSAGIGFIIDDLISIQTESFVGSSGISSGWLIGRFEGFSATWLWASTQGWRTQDLLLVGVPICWLAASQKTWGSSESARYLSIGTGLLVLWWAFDPQHIVPGLLVAFPLLVLLTGLVSKDAFVRPIPTLGIVAFVLYAGAVILGQYSVGGTSEWGGRYFAAGIPFVLVGMSSSIGRLIDGPAGHLRRSTAPVMLASIVLVSAGIGGLRHSKQLVSTLGSSVDQAIVKAEASEPDGDVVVVSTSNAIGRLLWAQTSGRPWLLVPPDELNQAMGELDAAGVSSVIVIAERHQQTDKTIGAYVDVDVTEPWAQSPVEILAFHAE